MRVRSLLASAALVTVSLAAPIAAHSQSCASGYTQLIANYVGDASGALLGSGNLTVWGEDQYSRPLNYRPYTTAGGVVTKAPVLGTVATGVIQGTFCVVSSSGSEPVNVRYHITITDNSQSGTAAKVVDLDQVYIDGTTFDLDLYNFSGATFPAPTYGNLTALGALGSIQASNGTGGLEIATEGNVIGTLGYTPTAYLGVGIPAFSSSTAATLYAAQGTDSKLLTAGTVSGSAGATLCIDALAGATTTGCAAPSSYAPSGIVSSTGTAWGSSYSTSGSGSAIALTVSPAFTTPSLAGLTGTGNVDFSGASIFKLPVTPGCVTTASGEVCHDSTNHNFHIFDNGVDNFVALFPSASPPISGHLISAVETGTAWTLNDTGGTYSSLVNIAPTGSQIIPQPIAANYQSFTTFCPTNIASIFYADCFPAGTVGSPYAWSISTAYAKYSSVSNLGTAWIAVQNSTGITPGWFGLGSSVSAWSSATAYTLNQEVDYNNVRWVAVSSSTNVIPSATNSSSWVPVQAFWYTPTVNLQTTTSAAWSGSTSYIPGTFVSYGGAYYYSIAVSLNEEPDINPFFWAVSVIGSASTIFPWRPDQFSSTLFTAIAPTNIDIALAVVGAGLNNLDGLFNQNAVIIFGAKSQGSGYSSCGGLFVPMGSNQSASLIGWGSGGLNQSTGIDAACQLNWPFIYKGAVTAANQNSSLKISGISVWGSHLASSCGIVDGTQGLIVENVVCSGGFTDIGGQSDVLAFGSHSYSENWNYQGRIEGNTVWGALTSAPATLATVTDTVSGGILQSPLTVSSGGVGYVWGAAAMVPGAEGSGFAVNDTISMTQSSASGMVLTVSSINGSGGITGLTASSCSLTCAATYTTAYMQPITIISSSSGNVTGAMVNVTMLPPLVYMYNVGNEVCGVAWGGALVGVSNGAVTGVTISNGGASCGTPGAIRIMNNSGFTNAVAYRNTSDSKSSENTVNGDFVNDLYFAGSPMLSVEDHASGSGEHTCFYTLGGTHFIAPSCDTGEHNAFYVSNSGNPAVSITDPGISGNGTYSYGIGVNAAYTASEITVEGSWYCYAPNVNSNWTGFSQPQPNGFGSLYNGHMNGNFHYYVHGTCDQTNFSAVSGWDTSSPIAAGNYRPAFFLEQQGASGGFSSGNNALFGVHGIASTLLATFLSDSGSNQTKVFQIGATTVTAGVPLFGTTATFGTAGTSNGTITLNSSTSGGSLILTPASASAAYTVTIPAATDTLVNLAGTQTLSNKTFVAPVLGAATGTSLILSGALTANTSGTSAFYALQTGGLTNYGGATFFPQNVANSGTCNQANGSLLLDDYFWSGSISVTEGWKFTGFQSTCGLAGVSTMTVLFQPAASFTGSSNFVFSTASVATSGANFNGPLLSIISPYWTGSNSAPDIWNFGPNLGSGPNPTSQFTLSHIGGGTGSVYMPFLTTLSQLILGGGTPTVTSGQIGFGTTTAAASNCGAVATACLVINQAGTTHYIPYY